jgi:hypothetical protein
MGVTLYPSDQEKFFLGCLTFEDGADILTQNVGNKLPFYAA